MKKIVLLTLFVFSVSHVFSQKMMTRNGEIKFEASMPTFEEIAATNTTVSCIFDMSTGDFVTLALVKGFKFKSPLMEEHFNENYLESSKFPKSTFKGKVLNFNASQLTSAKTVYDLEGDLTMHGVTKKIKTKITLSLNSGKVQASCNLLVKPEDYKIDIPNVVKNKIADNIKVAVNFSLEAQ